MKYLIITMFMIVGCAGKDGAVGNTGAQGERGIAGVAGPQGQPGETGPQGDTGDRGEDGATGPQGESGENGTPGTLISIVDPCGDGPSVDEVVLIFSDGTVLVWYQNIGLSVLIENVHYVTTDQDACRFKIVDGEVIEL
jgi:hypothetical protein